MKVKTASALCNSTKTAITIIQTPTIVIPPIKTARLLNLKTVKLLKSAPRKFETPMKVDY